MKEKQVLNNETIKRISLFEKITRAAVKDSFTDKFGTIYFVVNPGNIKKALGKDISNVKKIENLLKSKLRIIEYNQDIIRFIKNLIFPIKIAEINLEESDDGKLLTIVAKDIKSRGYLIGKNAQNLRNYEFIANKYFNIKEIKVTV